MTITLRRLPTPFLWDLTMLSGNVENSVSAHRSFSHDSLLTVTDQALSTQSNGRTKLHIMPPALLANIRSTVTRR